MGLALEGYGGETQVVEVSALKALNLKELAEAVSTQATLMGLKSEYNGLMEGAVVESRIDTKRGYVFYFSYQYNYILFDCINICMKIL